MGRVPLDRLPRRRRGRDRQSQREAADPLLPGGRHGDQVGAARAMRRRRGDRRARPLAWAPRLRGPAAAHPSGREPRQAPCRSARPRTSSRSTCSPSATATSPREPFSERRRVLEEALAGAQPPIHVTPATRRSRGGATLVRRVRGRGARRRRRQAARRDVSAGQTGDVQDQARPNRGLCRRWLPDVQGRRAGGRLAAARSLRRQRRRS